MGSLLKGNRSLARDRPFDHTVAISSQLGSEVGMLGPVYLVSSRRPWTTLRVEPKYILDEVGN